MIEDDALGKMALRASQPKRDGSLPIKKTLEGIVH